jgi:hypothetical protein
VKNKVVRMVLEIQSEDGHSIVTSCRPMSQEDAQVLSSWDTGGISQFSYAMMIEFLKSEAYAMAISMLSRGVDLSSISDKDLSDNVMSHFLMDSKPLLGKISHGILCSLRDQQNK